MRGKKKYFSTNIYVEEHQWDKKHRKIKNHPNEIDLNRQIKDFTNSLEDAELQLLRSGKPFTLDYLKEFLKGNTVNSFLEFCWKEVEKSNLKNSTKIQHRSTLRRLGEFRKEIRFDDDTYESLTDFKTFLSHSGIHKNTIIKYFTVLRTYVNLAINKEFIELNKYPFRKFKIKKVNSKREFLTPEELEKRENLELTGENAKY